jgi:hypothetical protein
MRGPGYSAKHPRRLTGPARGEDHADGRVHAPLDDGRLVALPAERVKLLAITAEMADAGRLTAAGALVLPTAEVASIIDPAVIKRNQKFVDSPLEGRVLSEPVSEMGFSGCGNQSLIPRGLGMIAEA